MNIDRIIRESIDRFILREIDEARSRFVAPYQVEEVGPDGVKRMVWVRTKEEHEARAERARQKMQASNPNYVPPKKRGRPPGKMKKLTSFFDIDTDNPSQIRRTLRSAWQTNKLTSMYNLRDKLVKEFGIKNATMALSAYGEIDEHGNKVSGKPGLLTQFNQLYDRLNTYTTDIENYGNDIYSIESRLKQFPQILDDLVALLWKLCDRSSGLAGKLTTAFSNLNANIISGYKTSKGLSSRPIFKNKSSKEMKDITTYYSKLSDYIRNIVNEDNKPIDMTQEPVRGIKTISKIRR